MKNNCFIAVSGNIGAGKTTWTNMLARHFNITAYFEKVKENPYLDDFYRDMKRWAFQSQIFFLTQRFNSHLEIQARNQDCVLDRTIYEDSEIFARNLFNQELMSKRDFQSYYDLYETMLKVIRYPDLLIYLKAPVAGLLERIQMRNRDCERSIPETYLAELNTAYDAWIKKMEPITKVIIIDTDDFNFFQDRDKTGNILKSIEAALTKIRSAVG